MATTLVWDSGDVQYADNGQQILGEIDVSQFLTIRVSAYAVGDSPNPSSLFLVHVIGPEAVTTLDLISLTPGPDMGFSNSYDIPGTLLNIAVRGSGATANQLTIRVLIYGA